MKHGLVFFSAIVFCCSASANSAGILIKDSSCSTCKCERCETAEYEGDAHKSGSSRKQVESKTATTPRGQFHKNPYRGLVHGILIVHCPKDAIVWLDGRRTWTPGSVRQYSIKLKQGRHELVIQESKESVNKYRGPLNILPNQRNYVVSWQQFETINATLATADAASESKPKSNGDGDGCVTCEDARLTEISKRIDELKEHLADSKNQFPSLEKSIEKLKNHLNEANKESEQRIAAEKKALSEHIEKAKNALNKLIDDENNASNKRIDAENSASNKRIDAENSASNKRIDAENSASNKRIDAENSASNKRIDAENSASNKRIDAENSASNKRIDAERAQ